MMSTPLANKESPAENKPIGSKQMQRKAFNHALDEITQERIILDLFGGANSPNFISRHFLNVYRIIRKYHAIRRVLFKHSKRVAQLNARFDQIICDSIILMEIDETFKGRNAIFLLVVDATTGYILFMQWIPQRTKETILAALMPFQALFSKVRVILTDGAPYYPEVSHLLCPQAVHQLCLIHIIRNLFKLLQPAEQQYH